LLSPEGKRKKVLSTENYDAENIENRILVGGDGHYGGGGFDDYYFVSDYGELQNKNRDVGVHGAGDSYGEHCGD
jgi:hypothetical protein